LERSRIEAVFFNLIINALEAMPQGAKSGREHGRFDRRVFIEVEDTGPGIPAAIRERLFEPFVTSGKEHGLGLGLAPSRETVLNHGGDIWIEPADGARFVVRLPLKQSEMKRPGSPLQSTPPMNSVDNGDKEEPWANYESKEPSLHPHASGRQASSVTAPSECPTHVSTKSSALNADRVPLPRPFAHFRRAVSFCWCHSVPACGMRVSELHAPPPRPTSSCRRGSCMSCRIY
jgi:Histidine kinase-, DNA gyrase B-, and HSP90-like ATPase